MSEISLKQAYRLLGAAPTDSEAELKKKYHQSIRRCHPDVDPQNQERAHLLSQKINAAYHLILEERKHPSKSGSFRKNRGTASARPYHSFSGRPFGKSRTKRNFSDDFEENTFRPEENPAAFCSRVLFRGSSFYETFHSGHSAPFEESFGSSHHSETIYGHVSEGRYLWDPNHESFALFMLSVHRKCQELVHGKEAEIRLFHLLLQEYIRPWTCLVKIAEAAADIRAEGNGFHLPAELSITPDVASYLEHAASGSPDSSDFSMGYEDSTGKDTFHSSAGAASGDSTAGDNAINLTAAVRHDRIHILAGAGIDLGHITFTQDCLYVIVLPLIARRCVQVSITPSGRQSVYGQKQILHLDLCLSDPIPVISDRPANNSLEIAALLRTEA